MLSLSQQNPHKVLAKIKEKLEHNHNRMQELQKETQLEMQRLLLERIPQQYVTSTG
jgi:adenylate kinase